MEKSESVKGVGIFLLACSIIGIALGYLGAAESNAVGDKHSFFHNLSTVLFILFPWSCLVASIGLMITKGWGRVLTIANFLIASIWLPYFIILEIKEIGSYSVIHIVLLLIVISSSAGFIYYLTRPKVKEQFK